VLAIPWPSGRWRDRRRINTGHAGRLHSRKRARDTATLPRRGARGAGKGVPPQRRRLAGAARRPREGPSLRRAAHLRTVGGAADTAHGRAGGTDCRATGRL